MSRQNIAPRQYHTSFVEMQKMSRMAHICNHARYAKICHKLPFVGYGWVLFILYERVGGIFTNLLAATSRCPV